MNSLRPKFHIPPSKGWVNDPNGFCYFKGQYHLFAQYNPHDVKWGPMHWPHFVSKDLVYFEEVGVALASCYDDIARGQKSEKTKPFLSSTSEVDGVFAASDAFALAYYAVNQSLPIDALITFDFVTSHLHFFDKKTKESLVVSHSSKEKSE